MASTDNVESSRPPDMRPYSTLSKAQKHGIVCLLAYTSLASSLTATIYLPLINLLADEYHTTVQNINLTITLYLVFQGIAPSFWTPLADSLGRRPVIMMTLAVYTFASLSLSLSHSIHNYAALMLLRGFQSIGGAAVLALAYAVVADMVVHSERGSFLGPMLAAGNLGPCVGPLIGGGAILASGQTVWCFWALFIFGASSFLLVGLFLPETLRSVVGNGEVEGKGMWRSWSRFVEAKPCLYSSASSSKESRSQESRSQNVTPISPVDNISDVPNGRGKWVIPNPFTSFRLLLYRHALVTLLLAGMPYSLWYCIQTTIPIVYGIQYGFNDLQVGLCYLPGGLGVIIGGLTAGRLMDMSYKFVAAKEGLSVDRDRGDDMAHFPIEEARSRWSLRILGVSLLVVVGWAWACQFEAHPAVPLVLQAFIGWKCTVLHQFYSTLIVDIFPNRTGTAAAANNVVRCAMSAAAVAVMQPLLGSLNGWGWTFTMLGLIDCVGCFVLVFMLRRYGVLWRAKHSHS